MSEFKACCSVTIYGTLLDFRMNLAKKIAKESCRKPGIIALYSHISPYAML